MLKNIIRVYKDIYSIDKRHFWIQISLGLFNAVVPFVALYFSQQIINQLMVNPSWDAVLPLVIQALVVSGIVLFLRSLFENLLSSSHQSFYFRHQFRKNDKLISMKYEHIEDGKVEQLKSNLRIMAFSSLSMLEAHAQKISEKITHIISIILALILLVPVFVARSNTFLDSIWVVVGLIVIFVLLEATLIFSTLKSVDKTKEAYAISFERNNLFNYLFPILFQQEAGKEIRIYNHEEKALHIISDGFVGDIIMRLYKLLFRINMYLETHSAIIHTIFSTLVYLVIGIKALEGNLGVGYIVSSIGAVNLLTSSTPELLSQITTALMDPYPLELYYQFMDLPEEKSVGTIPIEKRLDNDYQLSVKDLSFAYPGSENLVLKNVNLDLEVGKSYSIVGENGSGKTTFIKLLTRLYSPQSGSIQLNGIDALKYNPKEYAELFNIVFQDFSLFGFELGETIATSKAMDESKIMEVIEEVGFKERFDTLDKGLKTILSKEFDPSGIQLSGGEEQKVALARALYKNGPIFILDEPTAALDPISEFEIYKNFQSMIQGRTSIFISHRLSSCRFADEILVFDQGQIVQRGSHDQLVAIPGKYQDLWNAQAQFYQEQKLDTSILLQ